MNWQTWLKGLVAAIISGAANSVTVMIVDPIAFNLTTEWRKVILVACASAIVGAALYLKQSPIPDAKTFSILIVCLLLISQSACGPDTLRKRVAVSIDSSGNAVDLAFGITQDLYDYKKISADEARRITLGLRKANSSLEVAGKRALNWISEVEAAERRVKERDEKFDEPKAMPKEVREDIERLLDEAVLALRDIGDVTEKRLFKQISRILEMINRFRRLLSG